MKQLWCNLPIPLHYCTLLSSPIHPVINDHQWKSMTWWPDASMYQLCTFNSLHIFCLLSVKPCCVHVFIRHAYLSWDQRHVQTIHDVYCIGAWRGEEKGKRRGAPGCLIVGEYVLIVLMTSTAISFLKTWKLVNYKCDGIGRWRQKYFIVPILCTDLW